MAGTVLDLLTEAGDGGLSIPVIAAQLHLLPYDADVRLRAILRQLLAAGEVERAEVPWSKAMVYRRVPSDAGSG